MKKRFPYFFFDRAHSLVLALAVMCGAQLLQVPALAQVSQALQTSGAGHGIAVPIGGALKYDNDQVWKRLVELAGGKGAKFAVFATASGDPEKSAERIIEALTKHGAVAVHIPVSPKLPSADVKKAVRDPLLIAQVMSSRGIYFAGGAQERITDALYETNGKPTPMLNAIWDVFNQGGVVAGTSAGAAIMSTTMFRDPPAVLDVLQAGLNGLREGSDIDRGLGFVGPDVFVDQHFLKRGRIGRMLPLMVQKGYKLGVGVDENTAVIFNGDDIEVIDAAGSKGALVADFGASTHDKTMAEFNVKDVKLTYLDRGDRFNLKTKILTISKQKLSGKKIDPNAEKFTPFFTGEAFYPDILGDTAIINAMSQLIDGKQKELIGLAFNSSPKADHKNPQLGFEFKLRKGADSLAYFTSSFGGEDYTVINIYLDVIPVTMAKPLYQHIKPSAHTLR